MLNQNIHYVPVLKSVYNAALAALGDNFDGTVNTIDRWLTGDALLQHMYSQCPEKVRKYPNRYVWTAYVP